MYVVGWFVLILQIIHLLIFVLLIEFLSQFLPALGGKHHYKEAANAALLWAVGISNAGALGRAFKNCISTPKIEKFFQTFIYHHHHWSPFSTIFLAIFSRLLDLPTDLRFILNQFLRLRSSSCPPELKKDLVLDVDHFASGSTNLSVQRQKLWHAVKRWMFFGQPLTGKEQYIVNWWPGAHTKAFSERETNWS